MVSFVLYNYSFKFHLWLCCFGSKRCNVSETQSDDVIGYRWRNDLINYHFVLLMPVNTAYLPLS